MTSKAKVTNNTSGDLLLTSLDLSVGAKAVVEMSSPKRSFKLKVIGAIGEQQLLLSKPSKAATGQLGMQGRSVNVHLVTAQGTCSFQSRLLQIYEQPIPCWSIAYPEKVKLTPQMRSSNVKLQLPVGIEHRGDQAQVDIPSMVLCTDLSLRELRVQAPLVLAGIGEAFFFTIRLKVNEVDQMVLISAVLKQVRVLATDIIEHQFSFLELEDETKVIIAGFVYGAVLAELGYSDE